MVDFETHIRCLVNICGAKQKGSRSCLSLCDSPELHAVLLAEFFDAAGGVNDLLLAGVKRMAQRADFDIQRLAVGGTGLEGVPAAAGDRDFVVIGMDIGFHAGVLEILAPCAKGGIILQKTGTFKLKSPFIPIGCRNQALGGP
jgi:hypothetical protein